MTMTLNSQKAKGFTLVELLVTIAILGILLGLLLPNLAAVQATAKAGAQAATAQSYMKGYIDYATLDSQGRLCSSQYDHFRDGDFTKIGWVADLVNNKYANPTKSLDPINRSKVNEKFCDAAGSVQSGTYNRHRWNSTPTYDASGTVVSTSADIQGVAYWGSTQTVWDDGYNTNFATSWQFGRGDNNIKSGNFFASDAYADDGSKSPGDGDGPLSGTIMSDPTFLSSADKIPVLGPARVGDGGDSQINASGTNAAQTINQFIDPTGRKTVVKVGDFSCESFCDGPNASVNLSSGGLGVYARGASTYNAQIHEINDIDPNCKRKKMNMPYGTGFVGGYVNMGFADGSCRRVNDNNGYQKGGDGWIGPYPVGGSSGTGDFVFTDGAYDEVRDDIYLGRMRAPLTAGGGPIED